MDMIRVSSRAIASIGYELNSQRMQIKFSQGQTYSFCRVPQHVFDGLLASGSKGSYYDSHIRGKYSCQS